MDQSLRKLFDEGAQRRGTGCEKWDELNKRFGRDDLLPMWVADMDFQAPEAVTAALVERAQNGVFGYAVRDEEGDNALINWMKARHGLDVSPEQIIDSPGVVSSMVFALRAVAEPGDKVAIMTPVYGPFYRMTKAAGMTLRCCPLMQTDEGYKMNLDLLESEFKGGVKALLMCSPHNPVGRVWTMDELKALVSLCNQYGVVIVSDEIHMDFEMPGHRHTPILNVPGAERSVMLASATKTFNLAALRHSTMIVKDEAIRTRIESVMAQSACFEANLFGSIAQKAAYQHGAEWLDGLIEYVDENRQYVEQFLADKLPEIKCTELQGTYLLWLDFRALGLDAQALRAFLVDEAKIALNNGTDFGEDGAGFARMNLATPRRNVEEGMARIERAVRAK